MKKLSKKFEIIKKEAAEGANEYLLLVFVCDYDMVMMNLSCDKPPKKFKEKLYGVNP